MLLWFFGQQRQQFAGAADKMREAGIDGDYLAHASDDDLAIVFQECGLTKLQQSLLKQKLRKATRAPVAPPPLPPRPISPPPPKDDAPTPPASPKAKAPAPLRVRVTCPADGHAGKPIVVQIPDGRKARGAIPDVAPGETFTILVPAAPLVHRVSVTCPPDKAPGSQLLVKVPSGQTIRATVPQRLGPGRSFTVVAPAAPVASTAFVRCLPAAQPMQWFAEVDPVDGKYLPAAHEMQSLAASEPTTATYLPAAHACAPHGNT